MTANIDILTDKRENVIIIPQRAVVSQNGDKIVKILEGEKIREVKVKTGLRGSDGNVEIIEGVKEGEKVVLP
jgi:HlyD family secretion protein